MEPESLVVMKDIILAATTTPDKSWPLPLIRFAGKHLDYVAVHSYLLESHVGMHRIVSGSIIKGKQSIPMVYAITTTDSSGMNWSIADINRQFTS